MLCKISPNLAQKLNLHSSGGGLKLILVDNAVFVLVVLRKLPQLHSSTASVADKDLAPSDFLELIFIS